MTCFASQTPARALTATLALSVAASAAACNPYRVDTRREPPVDLPETYGAEAPEGELPDQWWQAFGDPQLETLVRAALDGNLQLEAAWARLEQAEALVSQARAPRWPQLDASLQGTRGERVFPPIGKVSQEVYSLSLPVSYELDVWNKYGAGIDAASASAMASRDDVEATAMTVAAEVTEAWFDVRSARATLTLLETQLETNETFAELTELRFEQGLVSAVDVYQQRQQVLAIQAQLETAQGQLVVAENRLSVLLGQTRAELSLPEQDALPEAPALPGVGVPADLLERRPDLRAARARLFAQDHQVAAAVADRLPSIRLNGELAFQAVSVSTLLDTFVTTIAGAITAPLIDGGRRASEVRRRKAAVKELLANYGQVLLQAIVEVENALALERQQARSLTVLEAQRETAEANLRESRARYGQGLTDYLPVLTALASLQTTERNLIDAQRQRLSSRVQLCRALGGTWTAALSRPEDEPDSASDKDPS